MLHHEKIYVGLGPLAVLISFALLDLTEPLARPLRMQNILQASQRCLPFPPQALYHCAWRWGQYPSFSSMKHPLPSFKISSSLLSVTFIAVVIYWPHGLFSSFINDVKPWITVFLFNSTYKIILGIHLLDPTDNVSSQFLYILRSNNLSFHIITTSNDPTSEQSQFHAPSLYLASTSYLSSSLILVLSFLPFSDLSGTWNSWPHLFCPCPSLSSCPNFSPCSIYRPIVQHIYLNLWQTPLISWQLSYSIVLIWKERSFYWYPYTFCLHMHTQAATSGVSKLLSLGQMWTTSCFYKVVLAHSHIHSFMYCLFLLACHNGRTE